MQLLHLVLVYLTRLGALTEDELRVRVDIRTEW